MAKRYRVSVSASSGPHAGVRNYFYARHAQARRNALKYHRKGFRVKIWRRK